MELKQEDKKNLMEQENIIKIQFQSVPQKIEANKIK